MKNIENAYGFYKNNFKKNFEGYDSNKPQLYWDGYQWINRPANLYDFEDEKYYKKQIQISNVPLHLNLDEKLFKKFIIKNMIEKNAISHSERHNKLIDKIEFNFENNTAILTMNSKDLAKKIILIDGIICLGYTLRVSPLKEVKDIDINNIKKEAALANNAHLSAKSAAISFAVLQNIIKKNNKDIVLNVNDSDKKINLINSKIIKIMNIIDKFDYSVNLEEIIKDIKVEFEKIGEIEEIKIITKDKIKLGAEFGSIFIKYKECNMARNAIKIMNGKKYKNKEISIVLIKEEVYQDYILK